MHLSHGKADFPFQIPSSQAIYQTFGIRLMRPALLLRFYLPDRG